MVWKRFLTIMYILLLTLGQTLKIAPKFEFLKLEMIRRNLRASGRPGLPLLVPVSVLVFCQKECRGEHFCYVRPQEGQD